MASTRPRRVATASFSEVETTPDTGHADVHHAIQHAKSYRKSVAYLVIVSISGRHLELPTDGETRQPQPYPDIAGVRV